MIQPQFNYGLGLIWCKTSINKEISLPQNVSNIVFWLVWLEKNWSKINVEAIVN